MIATGTRDALECYAPDSGKIPFSLAFPLPFFAHKDKNFKDLLHGNGIDLCLDCSPECLIKDRPGPLLIMNRETLVKFQPRNLPGQFLPVGDMPDYFAVHPIDLPSHILDPHAQLLNNRGV